VIAHVDMDAFFVSVELLRRPELRGKPVVVATGTDPTARGVVMAASYEARKYGVHSALPLAIAHRRCPDAVLLPRDIALYRRASKRVMEILRGYSDSVEVAGLDEAYLDLSRSLVPRSRALELKREVRDETRLVCSIGLAPNKLLAKIASDLDKPDGLCELTPERMLTAVGDRPAALLPGVGPKTAERLEEIGITTVAELARCDLAVLRGSLGPNLARSLQDRANGIDDRSLEVERRRKSESRETTFASDVTDRAALERTVEGLAESVCKGLDGDRCSGRTITLKIRLRPFRTHTRSRTLEEPTRDHEIVARVARELLERFDPGDPVRLLGVGVAGLAHDEPETRSDTAEPPDEGGPPEPLTLGLD
jgi:DNA polymerase-4